MKQIIIFGITGMSRVIAEYIAMAGEDKVVAYTVDQKFIEGQSTYNGLPLVPFEEIQDHYSTEDYYILNVLSSGSKVKHIAEIKFNEVKSKGYRFYTFIDPNSVVANSAKIGENCIICNSAIVEPEAVIEDGAFIRSSAFISHETHIGAFTYVAPKAALSSNIKVGRHCFIGTNATIRDGVTIGADSIVGAGTVVLKDLPEMSVYKALEGSLLPIDRYKIKP